MKEVFDLLKSQKGGKVSVEYMIGLVILLILVAQLGPTALSGLFNSSAFECVSGVYNSTTNLTCTGTGATTGVPLWIPATLGILGAVALIYFIWKAIEK